MLQIQLLLLLEFGLLTVLGGPAGAAVKVGEHQWAAWTIRFPVGVQTSLQIRLSASLLSDHHPRTTAFVRSLILSRLNYCQFLHGFFYF